MPAILWNSTVATSIFNSASSLPSNIWNSFKSDPRYSNIIYSHALKARASGVAADDNQSWIVCSTDDDIDFVLACTRHSMGTYPILIFCAHPSSDLTVPFVTSRMQILAKALQGRVHVERVYSVFHLIWCRAY